MKIEVNGNQETLDQGPLVLSALLEVFKVESPDMVTVQLNGDFVEKDQFETRQVQEGDQLEFLYFMGGGQGRIFL